MGLDRVPSGMALPNDFNVVIEIPMHSDPIKYEGGALPACRRAQND